MSTPPPLTTVLALSNRLADEFIPVNSHSMMDIANVVLAAIVFDETPEGKSIVRLADSLGAKVTFDRAKAEGIDFLAKTKMSGVLRGKAHYLGTETSSNLAFNFSKKSIAIGSS
jgi:high-affinity K+ transport system ATPase subunit B